MLFLKKRSKIIKVSTKLILSQWKYALSLHTFISFKYYVISRQLAEVEPSYDLITTQKKKELTFSENIYEYITKPLYKYGK